MERRRAAPSTRRLLGLLAALAFATACSDDLGPTLVDEPPRSLAPISTTAPTPEPEPRPTAAPSTVPEPAAAVASTAADPATDGPGQADPGTADPGTSDPEPAPGDVRGGHPEPADPGQADPGTADPGQADPGTADPGTADPGTADPGTADPGTADPGTADAPDPATTGPGPESSGAETSGPPEPTEPEPLDTTEPEPLEPTEPEPLDTTGPDDPGVDDSGSDAEPLDDALEVPLLGDSSGGSAGPRDAALAGALEALAARAPAGGCLAVRRAGETVFSRNTEAMLIPASLQKLLLAEAALAILGAGYTFTTAALAETAPAGGVLDGDLYLVGGGDPLLSTPDFAAMLAAHNSAGTPLAALAADLTDAGLTRIEGGVAAVTDRYDNLIHVPTWPARFATQSVAGSLSAVSVNQGWRTPPGLITTFGLAQQRAPALRAAAIFDDLLEARSVRIPNFPRVAAAGGDYSGHVVLATLESAPLAANLHWLLAESDNTLAEMLLKEIGLVARGAGTSAAGALAVHEVLAPRIAGLAVPADGSGLSPRNRLSCSQAIDVLDLGGPGGLVGGNLAVAGRSGTMENRYRTSPAAGLVRGKTGSLDGVAALAGFAQGTVGDVFSFASILNGDGQWIDQAAAFRFFDDLLEILVAATGG